MIEIKQLKGIDTEVIHDCFTRAFEDYVEPFKLSVSQLKHMIERRGYDENISFGAFDKGSLVGFTLNGKGFWTGEKTAYDTGTGMVKAYRELGLATRIFEESLEILKQEGITQYLLEVIKTNTRAFNLYRKAGFKISRTLDYFVKNRDDLKLRDPILPVQYKFRRIAIPDWDLFKSFWEFEPSWQNSIAAITRKINTFIIMGIEFENEIIAYGIMEPETGDIPQLCVKQGFRRRKLASALFSKLAEQIKTDEIKLINTEERYLPQKDFMKSLGFSPGFGQYEMILPIP
jgi:ribosomal protein S18 acetylase RimI-like enzyme